MSSEGAEALKEAIRRSVWLVLILVLLGAAGLNALRQIQGPRYEASSEVLISSTDLGATLTGIQQFVDPEQLEDTEQRIATSEQLFDRVAADNESLGRAGDVRDAMTVEADGGIITFTAETDDAQRSIGIVNAVADEYIEFRQDLTGTSIEQALRDIRREIAQNGSNAFLREQLNRLELLQTLNSGNAVRVARADSAAKTQPAPVRDSILGASIGFIVALLLAGAREALNTRVRSEADVEELLDVPVLASVQTLPRGARLVMLGRHEDTFGDTYALLAANLMQVQDGAGPRRRLLAITSATPSEGKTSTAANLAVALARRGANVILADFDVRRPSLAEVFRISNEAPGVVQAALRGGPLDPLLWAVPVNGSGPSWTWEAIPYARNGRQWERDGEQAWAPSSAGGSLMVLPAGGAMTATALARSQRLPALLENLRASADIVILDTPPALVTAEMTDLSRTVDMVLVVVRQGRVTRRNLESLRRQSKTWSSKFVGAVLTDVADDEHRAYYSYRNR